MSLGRDYYLMYCPEARDVPWEALPPEVRWQWGMTAAKERDASDMDDLARPKFAIAPIVVDVSPVCPYCGNRCEPTSGSEIYPHRADLSYLQFWICRPCKAWVGCHEGTNTPKGTPANAPTRWARIEAHAAFDPWWKTKGWRRKEAYRWLDANFGPGAHIGAFDVAQCHQLIAKVQGKEPEPPAYLGADNLGDEDVPWDVDGASSEEGPSWDTEPVAPSKPVGFMEL